MEVGCGPYQKKEWDLGDAKIKSCDTYKYLGDMIMRNGSNKRNLEEREIKCKVATRKIMTICSSEVIKKIEMYALLKMHETNTLQILLTNCETWVLNKGERDKLDKIELWALKKILDIPVTTPTAAVIYITGTLLTSLRVDQRQLFYLKTLLVLRYRVLGIQIWVQS